MGEDEAFLAAIRAQPTDGTLRLVYADWLEERGDGSNAGCTESPRRPRTTRVSNGNWESWANRSTNPGSLPSAGSTWSSMGPR